MQVLRPAASATHSGRATHQLGEQAVQITPVSQVVSMTAMIADHNIIRLQVAEYTVYLIIYEWDINFQSIKMG